MGVPVVRWVSVAALVAACGQATMVWAAAPIGLRVGLDYGHGTAGARDHETLSDNAVVASIDLEYHRTGGRAWLASARYGETRGEQVITTDPLWPPMVRTILDTRFASATMGMLQGLAPGPGAPFLSAGAGVGRFEVDAYDLTRAEVGFAWDAAFGLRIAPPPGPGALVLAVRAHQIIGPNASVFAFTIGVGVGVRPGLAREPSREALSARAPSVP
jgi:hypothetical protein